MNLNAVPDDKYPDEKVKLAFILLALTYEQEIEDIDETTVHEGDVGIVVSVGKVK